MSLLVMLDRLVLVYANFTSHNGFLEGFAMPELKGGCHCGNISVVYRTTVEPEEARPRACQCVFCRKHNTSAISDPAGELDLTVKDADLLCRYQFDLRTADFLVCRQCGVYMGAFLHGADDKNGFATLMSSVLDERARFGEGQPVSYSDETEAGRRQRRRKKWTPARLRFV